MNSTYKYKIIIFLAAILASFISCKKNNGTTTGSSINNTNTTNSGPITGYLIATRQCEINTLTNSLFTAGNTGVAYFFSSPNNISSYVSVGSVWVGQTKFSYQNYIITYSDTTQMLSINPTTWRVVGANAIPSFTYTNNDSLPTYTGFASLPDTIYKLQNLSLQINGVSGANLVEVILNDGTSVSSGHLITQYTASVSTNNTIIIPASSMAGFTPFASTHYPGSIELNFQKFNDQVISGKTYRFISQLQVSTNVYIK
jgi:hypothetical protein